jgi:hypothetical protein
MTNLINIGGINTVNVLADYQKGKFRVITKCRAGWMTIIDCRDYDNEWFMKQPESIVTGYTKGSLQTVEFCPDGGDYYLTVFARKGNKIAIIDEQILSNLTVGTINLFFPNTNLYILDQYHSTEPSADQSYIPYQVPIEA